VRKKTHTSLRIFVESNQTLIFFLQQQQQRPTNCLCLFLHDDDDSDDHNNRCTSSFSAVFVHGYACFEAASRCCSQCRTFVKGAEEAAWSLVAAESDSSSYIGSALRHGSGYMYAVNNNNNNGVGDDSEESRRTTSSGCFGEGLSFGTSSGCNSSFGTGGGSAGGRRRGDGTRTPRGDGGGSTTPTARDSSFFTNSEAADGEQNNLGESLISAPDIDNSSDCEPALGVFHGI
jgi:hypothetical protein